MRFVRRDVRQTRKRICMKRHPVARLIELADAAIVREDFDELMKFYSEDAMLVVRPGTIARGRDEIRSACERIAAHFDHSLIVRQAGMELLEAGDTVLVLANTVISADGASDVTRHATYVFKREAGEWLCIIDNSYGHELIDATSVG